MILILLDEPGWFLYASAEDAARDIEAEDIAQCLRAAFDDTGQPYAPRWTRADPEPWMPPYRLVPHGDRDQEGLAALLKAHPDVAEGGAMARRQFSALRRRGALSIDSANERGAAEDTVTRWRRSLEGHRELDYERAQFPITVTWLGSGECETFTDEQDLLCNLEDFDSDGADQPAARVHDSRGRDVVLRVSISEGLCEARVLTANE